MRVIDTGINDINNGRGLLIQRGDIDIVHIMIDQNALQHMQQIIVTAARAHINLRKQPAIFPRLFLRPLLRAQTAVDLQDILGHADGICAVRD